jgi:hypothetical protein
MNAIPNSTPQPETFERPRRASVLSRLIRDLLCLVLAVVLFVAYEHLKVNGQSAASVASLACAALLALVPVRALLGAIFAVERKALHFAHGLGGLMLLALPATGLVSGQPILTHAAMAPFAIMGAAQAILHQDHPRDARQAEALRRFASSLPEVAEFANPGSFSSVSSVSRASAVLGDLLSKAQALGQTELDADPGFQSALKNATLRTGLTLSLDAIDRSLEAMASNPVAAPSVPALRSRLNKVRQTIAHSAGVSP